MKRLRLLLLVLLAVLLPLRGALAGAMLCPPAAAGAGSQADMHVHDHAVGQQRWEARPGPAGNDQGTHVHGSHAPGAHGHSTGGLESADGGASDAPQAPHAQAQTDTQADTRMGAQSQSHPHSHPQASDSTRDKCSTCAACCAQTPLLGSLPALPTPPADESRRYPPLSAPAALFFAEGQDRPPRRI